MEVVWIVRVTPDEDGVDLPQMGFKSISEKADWTTGSPQTGGF
jgi:hypothetical protein